MSLLYTINRLAAIHIFGLIECEQQAPKPKEEPKKDWRSGRGFAEPQIIFNTPIVQYNIVDAANQPIYLSSYTYTATTSDFSLSYTLACGHKGGVCFKTPYEYVREWQTVVREMEVKGFAPQLSSAKGFYRAGFVGKTSGTAEADTLGLAIVVAALVALQVPDMEKHGED